MAVGEFDQLDAVLPRWVGVVHDHGLACLQGFLDQLALPASRPRVVPESILADQDMAWGETCSVEGTLAGTLQADEKYQIHDKKSRLLAIRFTDARSLAQLPGELEDLGGAAEGEEPAVANGERLDLRPGVIDGVAGAVEQHQIGVGVNRAGFGSAARPAGQAEGGGQTLDFRKRRRERDMAASPG
jgi:hypothetical protein